MIFHASRDGIKLNVSSIYRSHKAQKVIFLNRLSIACYKYNHQNCDYSKFTSGQFNKAIDYVLQSAAPSGMSKHHTGYAIDFRSGTGKEFKDSRAFYWLSKNNYFNAKKFGFAPSYPIGVNDIGPHPEAWEYIWVGKDNFKYPF